MARKQTTDRIRAEMDALIGAGMTVEQAARTIAERQTKAYFDGLAEAKRRKAAKRYR